MESNEDNECCYRCESLGVINERLCRYGVFFYNLKKEYEKAIETYNSATNRSLEMTHTLIVALGKLGKVIEMERIYSSVNSSLRRIETLNAMMTGYAYGGYTDRYCYFT